MSFKVKNQSKHLYSLMTKFKRSQLILKHQSNNFASELWNEEDIIRSKQFIELIEDTLLHLKKDTVDFIYDIFIYGKKPCDISYSNSTYYKKLNKAANSFFDHFVWEAPIYKTKELKNDNSHS
ncbi:MG284/MPN403 family protein [Mycoplasmoides pneumoniae]|uniref:Uncharacterized protein MG284 homolog n=4 Tax=Mycoplasmoides pneumoniae TaxID=2104 RepID=Y403_MYCPN|nr:hypothetical protein [Mycoplasmoides pneumoniae]P75381.1 RecName: Full=Uncharacterized protein MG284 homolog [Mycoplasmoides pneumoniae M129]AAB96083.1 conserved hypothetical protein [Mycoplasmoides pneumoniae M129]ADK86841.1 conserved hypothetical protein [Mycoplasmoides pneumoniae FH]AGC04311.1 hypothetical protein C985_0411 [Mycoplasmoides pneumoniae M129-B7]ALA31231.1 hypothetical protein B434_03800 [Mycoplasmoides pneumoniae 19294]ALA31678.1 hypothetical protein F536_02275 [Mycoplasmo